MTFKKINLLSQIKWLFLKLGCHVVQYDTFYFVIPFQIGISFYSWCYKVLIVALVNTLFIWGHVCTIYVAFKLYLVLTLLLQILWYTIHIKFKIGLSSPFKWHVIFKLGRPPFKESRWVVTSFKVTCYIQIRSSAFQRDTLGCHLVQSDKLYSNWVIQLSKRHVRLSPCSKWHVMFKLVRPPSKRSVGLSPPSRLFLIFLFYFIICVYCMFIILVYYFIFSSIWKNEFSHDPQLWISKDA